MGFDNGANMTDERYYCIDHLTPLNYLPEINVYVCNTCGEVTLENIIDERELIRAKIREVGE